MMAAAITATSAASMPPLFPLLIGGGEGELLGKMVG